MLSVSLRRIAIVLVLALAPLCGFAQDVHWAAGADGNWNVAANWTPAVVPASTDRAIIDAPGSYVVTVSSIHTVTDLIVGDGGSAMPILSVFTGGSLTPTGSSAIALGAELTVIGGMVVISGPGATLSSDGLITLSSNGLTVTNGATLINSTGGVILDGDVLIADPGLSGFFLNSGTIEKTVGTGISSIQPTMQGVSGAILVDVGNLSLANGVSVAGPVQVVSGATLTCPSVLLSGGSLSGGGSVVGNVTNQGGGVIPASGATLTISGTYQQDAAAIVLFEFAAGPAANHLTVGGTATLDGIISMVNSTGSPYTPVAGNQFTVIDSPVLTGVFSTVISGLGAGFKFNPSYSATAATLTVATNAAPVPLVGGVSTSEDTPVSGTLAATDPDGDPLFFSISIPPRLGTVTIDNTATGDFTYYPGADNHGSDIFYFVVSDGTVTTSNVYETVDISAVNDLPMGAAGTALSFAPGDYITVPHQAALTPPDMTLEAWVKMANYPGFGGVWIVAGSTNGTSGYKLTIDNGDGLSIRWTSGASSISQYPAQLPLDEWFHLAVTQTGGNAIIYLNGAPVASGTVNPLVDAGVPFTFGSTSGTDNSFLMDEVRIWNVVLSPSEIVARAGTSVNEKEIQIPQFMRSFGAVPATDLVAVWHLDQINGKLAVESANGFDGTIIGTPAQTGDMGVITAPAVNISSDVGSPGQGFLGVYDVDGPSHTFSIATQGAKGTVTIDDQTTGAFTYTVTSGLGGTDSFTYQVDDGSGPSSPATVNVQLGIAAPNITVGWVKPSADFYEGLAMPVTIQLSSPAPLGGLDISLNITGGIATSPADFTLSANPISVPAGATSVTVLVTPIDDAVLEPTDEDFTVDLVAGPGIDIDPLRTTFTGLIVDHEPLSLTALVGGSPVGTSIAVSIGQVIEFDLHDGVPVLGANGAPTFVYSTSAPAGTFTFFTTDLVRADGDTPTPDGDSDPVQKAVVCALRPGTYTFTVGDGLGTTDYIVTASDLAPIVVAPPVLPGSTEENTAYSAIGANTPAGLANLLGVAGSFSDTQASAYVWDASSQGYVRLPSQPSGGLTPGEAVFLASRVDFALDFDGVPLPMFFEVSLHPGWNFITIPSLGDGTTTFDTHAWNDLRVFDSTTNAELVSTERDAAIGVSAFLWDPLAGAYASVTSFDAGKGYWIRDNLASDLHIVRFPTLSLGNLNGFAASHQSRLYQGETPVKPASHRRQFAAGGPPLPPGGLHQHAASGNGCGVGSGAAGIVLLLAMAGFAALSRRRLDG